MKSLHIITTLTFISFCGGDYWWRTLTHSEAAKAIASQRHSQWHTPQGTYIIATGEALTSSSISKAKAAYFRKGRSIFTFNIALDTKHTYRAAYFYVPATNFTSGAGARIGVEYCGDAESCNSKGSLGIWEIEKNVGIEPIDISNIVFGKGSGVLLEGGGSRAVSFAYYNDQDSAFVIFDSAPSVILLAENSGVDAPEVRWVYPPHADI